MPKVKVLDLRCNKIYSYDCIEQLKQMKKLQTIYLEKNPIALNDNLKGMIMEASSHIEVVNNEKVRDAHHKIKTKIS